MNVVSHKELGKQIKTLGGTKPFICTDKGIAASGIADRLVRVIKEELDAEPVIFGETIPNPTDTNVHDGLKVYQDNGCDLVISLGGGSAHDCGKGIGQRG